MKKITFFVLSFFISVQLFSAPYYNKIIELQQPDGTKVSVKVYGDEYEVGQIW